jgi:hypothetical protein
MTPTSYSLIQCRRRFSLQANIGKNADVVGTSGSTTTGQSTMELDSSTIANTAALNLKIVGLYGRPR